MSTRIQITLWVDSEPRECVSIGLGKYHTDHKRERERERERGREREREIERDRHLDEALAGGKDEPVPTAVADTADVAEVFVKCQDLSAAGQVPDLHRTIW